MFARSEPQTGEQGDWQDPKGPARPACRESMRIRRKLREASGLEVDVVLSEAPDRGLESKA